MHAGYALLDPGGKLHAHMGCGLLGYLPLLLPSPGCSAAPSPACEQSQTQGRGSGNPCPALSTPPPTLVLRGAQAWCGKYSKGQLGPGMGAEAVWGSARHGLLTSLVHRVY